MAYLCFRKRAQESDVWPLVQTLEEGISSAAKAVEHSIKHGQPLVFVHTRSVTDLLNEVGRGDLSALDPSISGIAACSIHQPPPIHVWYGLILDIASSMGRPWSLCTPGLSQLSSIRMPLTL